MTELDRLYPDAPATRTAFAIAAKPDFEVTVVHTSGPGTGKLPLVDARPAASDWNRAILELATEYDREVTFSYEDAKGARSFRIVTPERIADTYSGAVVIYAVTQTGEDRAFRLDRIVGEVSVRPA